MFIIFEWAPGGKNIKILINHAWHSSNIRYEIIININEKTFVCCYAYKCTQARWGCKLLRIPKMDVVLE